MIFKGTTKEYIQLEIIDMQNCNILEESVLDSLAILWFKSDSNELIIDGKEQTFFKDQLVFLTEFHKIKIKSIGTTRFLRYNKPFYCILDFDAEVSCKGILFYGASQLPIIKIPDGEIEKFEVLWKMFTIEMQSKDSLQIDMLQMMLKRYLILCARIYKLQKHYPNDITNTNIIREFNYLVELHFRTKHTLAEYANLLYRSPKTISNIFSKVGPKTPLQYIKDRISLEARRLLRHTDKQIQEIAYEVGYKDVRTFSRFFKQQEGVSPSKFKENGSLGRIVNS